MYTHPHARLERRRSLVDRHGCILSFSLVPTPRPTLKPFSLLYVSFCCCLLLLGSRCDGGAALRRRLPFTTGELGLSFPKEHKSGDD